MKMPTSLGRLMSIPIVIHQITREQQRKRNAQFLGAKKH
jgi:hypothetical protein